MGTSRLEREERKRHLLHVGCALQRVEAAAAELEAAAVELSAIDTAHELRKQTTDAVLRIESLRIALAHEVREPTRNVGASPSEFGAALDTGELASLLGVRPERIRQWRSRGRGPRYYRFVGTRLYKITDVERWAREEGICLDEKRLAELKR